MISRAPVKVKLLAKVVIPVTPKVLSHCKAVDIFPPDIAKSPSIWRLPDSSRVAISVVSL